MKPHVNILKAILKVVFICSAISLIILISSLNQPLPIGPQDFELRSATVISLGFGASLGMLKQSGKKVKNSD